jgi:hypothetical protein
MKDAFGFAVPTKPAEENVTTADLTIFSPPDCEGNWTEYFSAELSQFEGTGIPRSLLDAVRPYFGSYEYDHHFVRLSVQSGHLEHRAMIDRYPGYIVDRFKIVSAVLSRLAPHLPDLDLELYLGDGFAGWARDCPAPVFAFSKNRFLDKRTLILPDPYSISQASHLRREVRMGNAQFPWSSKVGRGFWRGSTTGEGLFFPAFVSNPRVKLVTFSAVHPDLVDAAFTGFHPECEKGVVHQLKRRGYCVSHPSPISAHMEYKYNILVDGFTSPWPRYFWGMHGTSVLLKQSSELVGWFDSKLSPWEHYIPLANDLSDLASVIEQARDDDQRAENIARNAILFSEEYLTDQAITEYVYNYLHGYARLLQ